MNFRSRALALSSAALIAVALPCMAFAAGPHISEGTEFPIRFDDALSSGTNTDGDTFSISLAEDVKLPDGTVIPAGTKGLGEVTHAEKKGMLGKAGQLNVRFDYLKVGDTRVRLRGNKGAEGKGAIGATVALTVLFGPIGLIKKGHDVTMNVGQRMMVYADSDTDLSGPVAASYSPAPVVGPASPAVVVPASTPATPKH